MKFVCLTFVKHHCCELFESENECSGSCGTLGSDLSSLIGQAVAFKRNLQRFDELTLPRYLHFAFRRSKLKGSWRLLVLFAFKVISLLLSVDIFEHNELSFVLLFGKVNNLSSVTFCIILQIISFNSIPHKVTLLTILGNLAC